MPYAIGMTLLSIFHITHFVGCLVKAITVRINMKVSPHFVELSKIESLLLKLFIIAPLPPKALRGRL
jgi:hypothetical protein